MIFYFSGCGNSRHVAETLAVGLNDTLIFIPEAAREGRYEYELAENESLGFVFPVYSWAPPKLVLDFVEKMNMRDLTAFIKYVKENKPGIDYHIDIEKPESLGGGSMSVFLQLDQYVFLNTTL